MPRKRNVRSRSVRPRWARARARSTRARSGAAPARDARRRARRTSRASGTAQLRILGLADRALIWIDGVFAGALDDADALDGLTVTGHGRRVRLQIVVENAGRINYGWWVGRGKGILDGVLVNQRRTSLWRQTPVPLDRWTDAQLAQLASAEFDVDEPADTHLALPGSGKGFVWINGFLLGRYWERGPQRTLYVPAPLLRAGRNEVRVLELERLGATVELEERMDLGPVDGGPIEAAELP